MKKVFLGGTLNDSDWRERLIEVLEIDFHNPLVKHWTTDYQQEELKQREICDFCLYVITPKMSGVYSIAEAVDDSNKRPSKTVFCVLQYDDSFWFNEMEMRSLDMVKRMITENGGHVFDNLTDVANFLNQNK